MKQTIDLLKKSGKQLGLAWIVSCLLLTALVPLSKITWLYIQLLWGLIG